MKPFKYLLALPLALTSLVACGGSSYSKISYEAAVKMANSYLPSIKNHKASAIAISGHVNTIKISGDATFWSYSKPIEEIEGGMDLLTLIPNFSLKDGKIVVDQQEIATTSIPASIMSMVDSSDLSMEYKFYVNMPKFPVNRNMIKALYGFEKLEKTTDGGIDWEATEATGWDNADVTFAKNGNGSLKITIDTEDMVAFFTEVNKKIKSGGKEVNADPEPTQEAYPFTATITTNSIGYIDSLSVKTNIEDYDGDAIDQPDILYFKLKGDLKADFTLRFKQSFSKPMSIKYQLSYYKDTTTGEIPDIVWGNRRLKLDKSKSIGLTTNLDDFKDYVTFDWYKNLGKAGGTLREVKDDPIFDFNYWADRGKNIAFTNTDYDVLAIPTYDSTTTPIKVNYNILGYNNIVVVGEEKSNSYVSTSIDGRIISTDEGLPSSTAKKLLVAAGDRICPITVNEQKKQASLNADEIFINSNMLNSTSAECIINIAVAPATR